VLREAFAWKCFFGNRADSHLLKARIRPDTHDYHISIFSNGGFYQFVNGVANFESPVRDNL